MAATAPWKTLPKRVIDRAHRFTKAEARARWVRWDVDRHMAKLVAHTEMKAPSAGELRRIRGYARERFGSVAHAPWLEFYAAYRGRFVEGWVPEDFIQSVAMPYLNGSYHKLCQARTLQWRLLGSDSLPDLAHFVGGEWFDLDGARLERGRLRDLLFAGRERVCIKTEQSIWGRGVSFATPERFDLGSIEAQGNLVVQSALVQGAWFARVFPGAVTTVRIATGKLPGKRPHLVGAFLRIGHGAAQNVDGNSLDLPILDAAGTLNPFAVAQDWTRLPAHPDTGFRFEGEAVPDFERAVGHCLSLHDRLPQFGFVGWDVVIDDQDRVQVMEFNTAHPETRLLEMAVGPCFEPYRMEQYRGRAIKDVWA